MVLRIFWLLLFMLTCILAISQPEPCGPNPATTSTCLEACAICDIDGFTGTNNTSQGGQGFNEFCTTQYNRMGYIAFIAGTEDLEIQVTVTNCMGFSGLEVGIFESFDCENFSAVTFCDTDIPSNASVIFSNTVPLVVGQHYYLVMDGSNGTICDWTFDVLTGSTAVGQLTTSGDISGLSQTCPNMPTSYSTTGDVGAALFYWTVDGNPAGGTTQTVDITFPADGTYELCVTAANVCDNAPPSCVIVDVVTPGTLNLVEEICDNDCYDVAGQNICVTGIYDFVITLPNGCDSLIFLNLTVLPQAQEVVDINLCVGEEFLIGSTPYLSTGIFVDTILTAAACDSIVTLDLFMVECEIIGSTDFIPPVCNGDANGFLVFSVQNGTPPFTYVWEHITDVTIFGSGNTILFDNNQISNVPAGIYEINIMDDFGNNVVLFQEVTEPSILAVATDAIDIDGFNLNCNGGMDGTALATGIGGVPPYSFAWSDGQMQTGEQANNLAVGFYSVSITDNNGCVQTNNITLTEPTPIEFLINYIDPNCDGFETGLVQIDSIWGGTPSYQTAMGNGIFSPANVYQNLASGTYNISIIDDNGCETTNSGTLTAPDIPVLFMGPDLEVDLGCDILIPVTTNNTNLIDIIWTSTDYTIDCDNCLRPIVAPLNNASYFLTVTSIDDCSTSDSINVFVNKIRDVFIPNAFSPNGDGANDYFFINANKSVSLIKNMSIFSRWGAVVFEGNNLPPNDFSYGWNGFVKGKLASPGVYIWMAEIEYLDGEVIQISGNLTVTL
ncbi:MAG: gliding motility-associated C-terminal domain-containing protein [Saprospiraceae bacterium]|nr:gliding motility-associated C-terminal domain-containing protein [Saprospiraceae bacterium]MDG2419522.1 gliding motility-associated C-terminal domain-containing protein [Saprospiraceae bacterium]